MRARGRCTTTFSRPRQTSVFPETATEVARQGDLREAFFAKLIKDNPGLTSANTVATMTQFTIRTIEMGIMEFLLQKDISYEEIIVSGGGAKNETIIDSLRKNFPRLSLNSADDYPIMGRAKEAALYAFLANETIMGNPGNLPSATGAKNPVILGSITPGTAAL